MLQNQIYLHQEGEECCGGGCGCGHDHDHDYTHEHQFVTITLEDDQELKCVVLGNFEVEDKDYIALLPEGTDEVLIYRFVELEDGVDLQNIETDEEFEKVSVVFNEFMDEMEAGMALEFGDLEEDENE